MHGTHTPTFEQKRNLLSIRIINNTILMSLKNPLNLESYDDAMDLKEHVEYVDNILDY